MLEITLTQGQVALIDDEDYEIVSQYRWYTRKSRNTCYAGYSLKNKTLLMHRLIMKAAPTQQVDHINGNGLDNRRENLRFCTNSQNQMNKTGYGKSIFKGVTFKKQLKKWRARIKVDNKEVHLGYFSTEIGAAKAYDEAAKKYFGEFARFNLDGSYQSLEDFERLRV